MGSELYFTRICTKVAAIAVSSILLCLVGGGTINVNGYTDQAQGTVITTAPSESMPDSTADEDESKVDKEEIFDDIKKAEDKSTQKEQEQQTDTEGKNDGQKTDGGKDTSSIPDLKGAGKVEKIVTDFMKELEKLGYYKNDVIDKKLETRNAVILFQSDHNLVVDGIWGKKSLEALQKRLSSKEFSCSDEIDKAPTQGQWITINKTKRILTLYKGNTVIKKYPVAIGNPPSLTPDGKMSIVIKVKNPAWGGGGYAKPVAGGSPKNPLGYRWLGLSLKGGSTYGIHGTNSPYSIGTDASHGCIRMLNQCVEEMYEKIDKGIQVWIGTDAKLLEWGVKQSQF